MNTKFSEKMRRIKRRDTGLETAMAAMLRKSSIKYDYQPRLYGHPDFRIKKTSTLIFCDSSFWHGRRQIDLSGVSFKSNRKFWMNKLEANRRRDARIRRRLRHNGWSVHRFWDTDIIKSPEKVMKRLQRIIELKGK